MGKQKRLLIVRCLAVQPRQNVVLAYPDATEYCIEEFFGENEVMPGLIERATRHIFDQFCDQIKGFAPKFILVHGSFVTTESFMRFVKFGKQHGYTCELESIDVTSDMIVKEQPNRTLVSIETEITQFQLAEIPDGIICHNVETKYR